MFNRRMFVVLTACLVLSASTAMAGGGGGTKKNSTIKVVNGTPNTAFAFVDVSDADIRAAGAKTDPIAAFKALGGKQIAAGGNSATFKVKAGAHTVTVIDIDNEEPIGRQNVTTTKGKTSTVTFDFE